MSKLIDSRVLRSPEELLVTPTQPTCVLIVGSCLSEVFAGRMKNLSSPCESDLFLLGQPIDVLPRQVEEYDFQIVQLALRFVLPDMAFAKLSQTDVVGHERLFEHAVSSMRQHLERAMQWNRKTGILTFVFSFLTPVQNPVGRLQPRYDLRNPVYFVERLNEQLATDLHDYGNAYLFDINSIASYFGRRFVQDDVVTAMNHGAFISNYDFKHDTNRLESSDKATDIFEEKVWPFFKLAGKSSLRCIGRSGKWTR